MLDKLSSVQVTVRLEDAAALIRAACDAGWSAIDSGIRVTTEEGVDKEAVLLLRIPVLREISLAAK